METLSLTQQYLLCILGNKGKISSSDMRKMACFAASGVLELLTEELLVLEGKKVSIQSALPPKMEYLHSLYEFIEKKQPIRMEKIAEEYSITFLDKNVTRLFEDVGRSLKEKGCALEQLGGLLRKKPCFIPVPEALNTVTERIHIEFFQEKSLSQETVALAALLLKSGDISRYFSGDEKKEIKTRLKKTRDNSDIQIIKIMLDYIEALFIAAVSS